MTYQCNSRCSHCQLIQEERSKIFPSHINADRAVEIVGRVGQRYKSKSIMTFGGEPLLYPEIVCAIHEQARNVGIPLREVITNGFWAMKTEKVRKIAQNLVEFGINDVSISVDCFHQEFVPLKIVKKAATSLIHAGVERVEWNPCWVVSKNHDNTYNRRTKAILARLRNLHVEESEGNNVQPEGRACISLSEFLPPKTLSPMGKCGEIPYTETLDSVRAISVEPDGKVAVCKDFYIGNAFETDIINILRNYDPFKIPEAKLLLESGMEGLKSWAAKRGVDPNTGGYYNVCDMCVDLRKRAS